MKPYGRDKTVKGGKPWKVDYHPKKGYVNWWEQMCDFLERGAIKLKVKKQIEKELYD